MINFKKIAVSFAACLFLALTFTMGVCADSRSNNVVLLASAIQDDSLDRVVDQADLLKPSQENALRGKIDQIAEKYEFDVVILTVPGMDGKTTEEYANEYYENGGYGAGSDQDGVLLLISMAEQKCYISAHGYGKTAFTEYGIDTAVKTILKDLNNKQYSAQYSAAFTKFLVMTEDYIKAAKEGNPYSESHEYTPSKVVDFADLITDSQEEALTDRINDIVDKYDFEVAIVTVPEIGSKTSEAYADDFYDDMGYGMGMGKDRDGVLLLISMAERDWWISTSGYGETAFTDYGIQKNGEIMKPYLSSGDYNQAFEKFLDTTEDFVKEAKENKPYDYSHKYKTASEQRRDIIMCVGIGLLIALIISLIVVLGFKSQLKSVKFQRNANVYEVAGSMNVKRSNDIFLYKTVSKSEIPRNTGSSGGGGGSSTHISSSGRSHGGGGGKF